MEEHDLGALLQHWRTLKGRSVRDLAQSVNIHHTTLSRYLSGERRLNVGMARRFDEELDTGGVFAEAVSMNGAANSFSLESVPMQLPAAARHFVGRDSEWARLDRCFHQDDGIVVIDGPPGVGKTALAVHWATRAIWEKRFPGGALFVNLNGFTPSSEPLDPADVLEDFLRTLGFGEQIPSGERARAAAFRSELSQRAVLVVLDNAASAQQVRPLLPGTMRSGVLITSRRRLPGVGVHEGASRVSLDALDSDHASELLTEIIGERATTEPVAVRQLGQLCGALPLALRVAGERVVMHPDHKIRDLSSEFDEARLDALSAGDDQDATAAVRAAFDWSYDALDPAVARLFRLVGLHTGTHLSVAAVAALSGETVAQARVEMRVLCTAHLVVEYAPDRYRLHDLLRLYAAERAVQEETAQQRTAAVRRLVDYYLGTVDYGMKILAPYRMHPEIEHSALAVDAESFESYQQALAWCDEETGNICSILRVASNYGYCGLWRLAASLWDYFNVRLPWSVWIACNQLALEHARQEGDRYGEAWILTSMGDCLRRQTRYTQARQYFRESLRIRGRIDDRAGQGWLWFCLGTLALDENSFSPAITALTRGLDIFTKLDHPYAQGRCLLHRARAQYERHNIVQAYQDLETALEQFISVHDVHDQALVWTFLARIADSQHQFAEASQHRDAALPVLRRIGDWQGESDTLVAYGRQLWLQGQWERAQELWDQALTLVDEQNAAHEGRALRQEIEVIMQDGKEGHD